MAEHRKVIGKECRFVQHFPSKQDTSDIHLVKEILHFEDGTTEPNTRIIKNAKRPFYVVKKGHRNFQDNKEWISLDKLDRFECTQNDLSQAAAMASGKPWLAGDLRRLCGEFPYIFGADLTCSSYIKQTEYLDLWPELKTPYKLAAFDTETDMLHGTEEIIMASVTCKDRIKTVIKASFLQGIANPIPRIKALVIKYLTEVESTKKNPDGTPKTYRVLEARGIKDIDVIIVDTELEILRKLISFSFEVNPDFMAVWNIEFDMDKIVEACRKEGVDVADLLSHPDIPREYKSFLFKKGAAKKETASGRVINFKPSQRWHNIAVPAPYVWIDTMCSYRQIRTGSAEESSYGLDAIMNKHLGMGKLAFSEADHFKGQNAEWHKFMQSKYPLEYVVYNIFDCIGMEMLDEETLDMRISFPMFAGSSDFAKFNSMPRKAVDAIYWFCRDLNLIPGCTADDMTDEADEETTSISGWITMLPSHLIADNGLALIAEIPHLITNVRVAVADLDVTGAYPHNEWVFNVSKETTTKELVEIEGIPEEIQRPQTINFSAGHVNAVEFCSTMFGMPTLSKLSELYAQNR